MKLVTFDTAAGTRRPAVLEGDTVSLLALPDMRALFERGLDPASR